MKRPTALALIVLLAVAALPVSALDGPLSVTDQTIGGDILLSPGASNQSWPDMAYNDDDDQWLVVWQDVRDGDWDIYGQIVDSSGRIIDDLIRIAEDEEDLKRPAVAYDTTLGRYFVVWQKEGSQPAIEGQLLAADGSEIGAVVGLTSGLVARTNPDVAYNPVASEYLVVWEYEKAAGDHDIWGRKVSEGGTADPSGTYQIRELDADEVDPALIVYPASSDAAIAGHYLLVWSHDRTGDYNVVGQRLLSNGSPEGNAFAISRVADGAEEDDERYPAVALDAESDQVLVVWEQIALAGGHDILGRLIDVTTTPPGGPWLPVCVDQGDQRYPGVSNNGDGEFLVIWDDIYNMYGRRLSAEGTAASNQFAISDTEHTLQIEVYGAVAFGTNRYLVAWTDNRTGEADIVGQFLDPAGQRLGYEVGLSVSDAGRFDLALAYGTEQEQWLVVWYDQGQGPWRIRGQRVDREGLLVGMPVVITPEGFYDFTPAVAYNPDADEFLVVWEGRRAQSDILGQRVDAATGSLAGDLIQLTDDSDRQRTPAVAYNAYAGRYLVVWADSRDDDGSDSDWNIYGRRLNQDGTAHDSDEIVISAETGNQYNPDVAYSPSQGEDGQFLVVWEDESLDGWGIAGQRVKGGNPWKAGPNFPLVLDPNAQMAPSVACNTTSGEWLVIWEDDRDDPQGGSTTIYGRQLSVTGGLLGSGDIPVATGDYGHRSPHVSYDAALDRYYACWTDDRDTDGASPDIYGQAISTRGTLLSTDSQTNEAVWTYPGWQYDPVSAGDPADGLRLVAWMDGRSDAVFDIPEVYGVLREPSSEVIFNVFLPLLLKE